MLFNGEADMLAVHMAELDAVVDVFLVVEANVTFSHRPKPMYFPDLYLDEFAGAWRDQVAFHPVEVPVSVGAHWLTENYIRNQSRPALEHLLRTSPRLRGRSASDVFLVISDTDEVPCPHKLAYFRHCRAEPPSQPFPVPLGLGTFYYYSLRWDTGRAWGGAPVVWPAPMVLAEGFNGDQKRDRHAPVHPALRKCGWHMSYFMSPTRIREKLLAFSHKEYSGPPYTTLEHIRDKLSRAESLFTPTPMKLAVPDPRDSKAEIPRLIRANECYFKEWLGPFGCSYGEDDDEDGEGSDEDEDE
ncbi:glycosyl transferase [Hyaloraphidium curvatum]|nr:glycosyl transferase [Hyaloraphidium curvatum]